MQIIKASKEFTKKELFKITHNASTSLKDVVGSIITPSAYLHYEDENAKGETNAILAIVGDDEQIYTTISETATREFMDMIEIVGIEDSTFTVITGKTKAGRDFITVQLV